MVRPLLLATDAGATDAPIVLEPVASFSDAFTILKDSMLDLFQGFVANIPFMVVGTIIIVVGVFASRYAGAATQKAVSRTSAEITVANLGSRIVRASVMLIFLLLALAIAGIPVGSALAGLGIMGLAVAFALQSILENFIAGILMLIRKPFIVGDQIITNDMEGTVADINLRVTKLVDYDGEQLLVPNAQVFSNPIVNLTTNGRRRTSFTVGIDYRDDHDAAGEIITAAVQGVDGVLSTPPAQVLCIALGESSVDFEVRYWTQPDISTVRAVQDRALRASKSAIEAAGMTIPWPIRTLAWDEAPTP